MEKFCSESWEKLRDVIEKFFLIKFDIVLNLGKKIWIQELLIDGHFDTKEISVEFLHF
jgi:hypothetical protein